MREPRRVLNRSRELLGDVILDSDWLGYVIFEFDWLPSDVILDSDWLTTRVT